jgi:hypothetical protein
MIVVISGSRSISTLPKEAIERINIIINMGATILVGDAPGVDTEVQKYLKFRDYNKFVVFYAYQRCRNNLGFVTKGDYPSYTARDEAMCIEADYGLAIWDGKSKGTKANIDRVPSRVVRV